MILIADNLQIIQPDGWCQGAPQTIFAGAGLFEHVGRGRFGYGVVKYFSC